MVVHAQCAVFGRIAEQCGAQVTHVKPHGALYNQAVKSAAISRAIAEGVGRWRRDVAIMGLAGSQMLEVFRNAGFRAMAEAFADRRYEADGTLRSRKFDDALIRDPQAAAQQALRIANDGMAETICIHEFSPLKRMFFYLPLEHSENLDDQRESVRLVRALATKNSTQPNF